MTEAFRAYENIRNNLPKDQCKSKKALLLNDTHELIKSASCFFLDAYGVLNTGEKPIALALEFVDRLQKQNIPFLVLSNSASFSKNKTCDRLNAMGFNLKADDVITSREVLFDSFQSFDKSWGVIAPKQDFEIPLQYSFVEDPDFWQKRDFLFLSSLPWSEALQKKFIQHVKNTSCKIWVANPDISAPQHTGTFSKEPGSYTLLDKDIIKSANFVGKPFPLIFKYALEKAKQRFGVEKKDIMMVGDTLHTDILGANAYGLKSALIEGYGFFKGLDASLFIQESGIYPDVRLKFYK